MVGVASNVEAILFNSFNFTAAAVKGKAANNFKKCLRSKAQKKLGLNGCKFQYVAVKVVHLNNGSVHFF